MIHRIVKLYSYLAHEENNRKLVGAIHMISYKIQSKLEIYESPGYQEFPFGVFQGFTNTTFVFFSLVVRLCVYIPYWYLVSLSQSERPPLPPATIATVAISYTAGVTVTS